MIEGFNLEPPQLQLATAAPPFHAWKNRDGEGWLEFYRLPSAILLRFPGFCDFRVRVDGSEICCVPVPDVDPATLEHLYLNQILPLVQSARGLLSFHGSAVAVGGKCVGFLGPSGRGKSTLAASFAAQGCGFLTDDGLAVVKDGDHYIVRPSHPSLRLWKDSEAAVLPSAAVSEPAVSYTSKSRFMANSELRHVKEALKLSALFLLKEETVDKVSVIRLSPSAAAVEVLRNCFQLDVQDKVALHRQFEAVMELCEGVPVFVLDYVRKYELLPHVRSAVIALIKSAEAVS